MKTIQDTPEHDDEIPYAQDSEGKRIPDEAIISRGTTPQLFTFRAASQEHKVYLIMSGITLEARQAPSEFIRRYAVEHGVTGNENFEDDPDAARRVEEVERQAVNHPERFRLRAEMALGAIALSKSGRYRISIPQFQDELSVAKLIGDNIFGRAVVNAICAEIDDFFTG